MKSWGGKILNEKLRKTTLTGLQGGPRRRGVKFFILGRLESGKVNWGRDKEGRRSENWLYRKSKNIVYLRI